MKNALRSCGFGCYALHHFVWIVPFVHSSIHVPDFQRAKVVLPDLKGELLETAFSNEATSQPKKTPFNLKFTSKTWLAITGLAVPLILIF
jgi:hypothetical protein